MRGSTKGQTLHLMNTSGINQIGQSKFDAKNSARITLATEGRSATSTNIAEKTGIYSIATMNNFRGKWQELLAHTKEEHGLKDLEKLTDQHVAEFLAYKIELGVSYSHWSGYASAFNKLENALNSYSDKFDRGNEYSFRSVIEELRAEAKTELPRFEGTRDYDSPGRLIAAIGNESHRLVAQIQYESGLRLAGATRISETQLRGIGLDRYTGKQVGRIDYIGKGGKPGTAQVSPATYRQLVAHIGASGELRVGADSYRSSLKSAAQATGQTYNGSHGLRWNFAQERFSELQSTGAGYEKCSGVVSDELGHNRIEITLHYLGK